MSFSVGIQDFCFWLVICLPMRHGRLCIGNSEFWDSPIDNGAVGSLPRLCLDQEFKEEFVERKKMKEKILNPNSSIS